MKPIKHILMIGAESIPDPNNRPATRNDYSFIAAKASFEIEAVTAGEDICAALLDAGLPHNELVRCAQAVRWRWPAARILVVRSEEPHMDDALYDERLEPGMSTELLLASIERIIGAQQHGGEAMRLWEC